MKFLDSDSLVKPFIATPPATPNAHSFKVQALALIKSLCTMQQQRQLLLLPVT